MAAVQKITTMRPPTMIPTEAATPSDRNRLNIDSSEIYRKTWKLDSYKIHKTLTENVLI